LVVAGLVDEPDLLADAGLLAGLLDAICLAETAVATIVLPSVWYLTVTFDPTATAPSFCVDPFIENVMSPPFFPDFVITSVLLSIDFTVPLVECVAVELLLLFAADFVAGFACALAVVAAAIEHAAANARAVINGRMSVLPFHGPLHTAPMIGTLTDD
jgi:hypothetical protein